MYVVQLRCSLGGYKFEDTLFCNSYCESLESLNSLLDLVSDNVPESELHMVKVARTRLTSEMARYNLEESNFGNFSCNSSSPKGYVTCDIVPYEVFIKNRNEMIKYLTKEIKKTDRKLKNLNKEYSKLIK